MSSNEIFQLNHVLHTVTRFLVMEIVSIAINSKQKSAALDYPSTLKEIKT
jgi:hypothetical protein